MTGRRLIVALLFLHLTGCGEQKEPRRSEPPLPPITGVRVEIAGPRSVQVIREAVGTVRSRTTVVLSSKVVGTVKAVLAREGDRVEPNRPLIQIDDRELRAGVERAEATLREASFALKEREAALRAAGEVKAAAQAQLDLASATLGRYRILFERRSVAPQEFDEVSARHRTAQADLNRAEGAREAALAGKAQAEARIAQAQAEVTAAKTRLGEASIASSIAGMVTSKTVEPGNLASPGVPLLTIEDARHYRLETILPESEAGKVRLGQRVPVQIDALGGRHIEGSVAEIGPAADPSTRTVLVKLDLPDDLPIRSGFYGRGRFPIGTRQAILLPAQAISERGQLQGIYVLEAGDIARFRLVKVGELHEGRVEILSGLNDGERVVTSGTERLADGRRVVATP